MSKMYGIKIRTQIGGTVSYKILDNEGIFMSADSVIKRINSLIEGYEHFIDVNGREGRRYTDNFGNRVSVSYYIVELEVRT